MEKEKLSYILSHKGYRDVKIICDACSVSVQVFRNMKKKVEESEVLTSTEKTVLDYGYGYIKRKKRKLDNLINSVNDD